MRATLFVLLAIASCLGAGCGAAAQDMYMAAPFSGDAPVPADARRAQAPPAATGEVPDLADAPSGASEEDSPAAAPRKVIYTGRFNVVVADVDASVQAAKSLSERLGGYTLRMGLGAIVLRVPADKFDAAVAELARLGSVSEREIAAQDVTDRVLDLQLRLRNAKATREKLLALLDKAQAVKDALEIERELQRLTTEVEQLEGQISKLSHQVAYATLTIAFTRLPNAPADTRVRLPFRWLTELGLERLLEF